MIANTDAKSQPAAGRLSGAGAGVTATEGAPAVSHERGRAQSGGLVLVLVPGDEACLLKVHQCLLACLVHDLGC